MRVRTLLAALALVTASSCGGSTGVDIPPFNELVIGPGGGSAAAGTVVLNVPPGAFTVPTVVAILPEGPLPLDPLAPPLTYMPGVMCIGPLAQVLLVDEIGRASW